MLKLLIPTIILFAGCHSEAPVTSAPAAVSIVNGTTVSKREDLAHSLVAIIAEMDDGQALCTGTILSAETVLTAAHCVDHTAQMALVFNNRVNLAKPENVREVDGFVQYPAWHPSEKYGDLALIHFNGGLPPGFKPVSLDTVGAGVEVGTSVLLLGFGVTDGLNHKGSGVLRETASKILGGTPHAEIVSDGRESSVCFGDSGGPMFVERNGEWLQYGVAHSVLDTSCSQASVHTIVASYANWIVKTQAQLERR